MAGFSSKSMQYTPSIPVRYEVVLEHAHRVFDADIMIADSEV